jgi:hypothetical protein
MFSKLSVLDPWRSEEHRKPTPTTNFLRQTNLDTSGLRADKKTALHSS